MTNDKSKDSLDEQIYDIFEAIRVEGTYGELPLRKESEAKVKALMKADRADFLRKILPERGKDAVPNPYEEGRNSIITQLTTNAKEEGVEIE